MKFSHLMMCTAAMITLSPFASADNLQERFELQRPLEGTFAAGQQGRVLIKSDVFGQARNFPDDVRIFDAEGTQWPCFIYVPKEKVETASIGLNILNRAWVDGPEPYLQFDVVIPDVNKKRPVHNRLELVTSGHDFIRRVEIFAGDNPAGHMASGYLIEFSKQRDARNRLIHYPDSDVARLHVRIYPNAQSAAETFEVIGAYLRRQTETKAEREPVPFVELSVVSREQEEGAQTHILDVGQTDRPVEMIHFKVRNVSYTRCVSVYGRNTGSEEWQRVGGGEIHALPDDLKDTIRLRARCRFLKVHVFHYDDQPLDIAAMRLEAIPRYLVFEAATDGTATLCFRAWEINAPRYDLQGRIKKEALAALPVFQTEDTIPNQAAKAQPWRKYSKLLGGLAVGAVSLMVVWIIISMIRQQAPADDA